MENHAHRFLSYGYDVPSIVGVYETAGGQFDKFSVRLVVPTKMKNGWPVIHCFSHSFQTIYVFRFSNLILW